MEILRALVIMEDSRLFREFCATVSRNHTLHLVRKLDRFPAANELERVLRSVAPHVVFLEVTGVPQIEKLAEVIERVAPGTQMVAVSGERTVDEMITCMRCGMREYLTVPFSSQDLELMLSRIRALIAQNPPTLEVSHNIIAFLSSKPGCGATTAALHTSLEVARQSGSRTLLLDLDCRSSALDFMLKLPSRYGLRDAVDYAETLDDSIWERMVWRIGNLDLVGLGSSVSRLSLPLAAVGRYIEYACMKYEVIFLDMPAGFDEHAMAILEQCTSIFLVSTPELCALHMTKRRLELLEHFDLLNRTRVIVNRVQPRAAINTHLDELLDTKVFATVPNSYAVLQKAIQDGRTLDRRSAMGRQFAGLAAKCLGKEKAAQEPAAGIAGLLRAFLPGVKQSPPKQLEAARREKRILMLPPIPEAEAPMALVRYNR
jgi:pilus assembly protein CpaE